MMKPATLAAFAFLLLPFCGEVQAGYCYTHFHGPDGDEFYETHCDSGKTFRTGVMAWFDTEANRRKASTENDQKVQAAGATIDYGTYFEGNVSIRGDSPIPPGERFCAVIRSRDTSLIDCADGGWTQVRTARLPAYLSSHGYIAETGTQGAKMDLTAQDRLPYELVGIVSLFHRF